MADDPDARYRNLYWLGLNGLLGLPIREIARREGYCERQVQRGIADARAYGLERQTPREIRRCAPPA